MRFSFLAMLVLSLDVALLPASGWSAEPTRDQAEILALISGTFERPNDPLSVEPIIVQGDLAIAGWAQGDMGGRALLRRQEGRWAIVLCSGDALKTADMLAQFGLSKRAAVRFAAALAEAESKLPPERVALFSRFDGVVMMDADGAHPLKAR